MPFEGSIDPAWIDMFNLPPNYTGNIQVFKTPHNGGNWEMWYMPEGCVEITIICVGGGGGGGGGFSGASTTARGGGAGGACSGLSKLIVPALFCPKTLRVQVGNGGAGGTGSGVNGSAGLNSYVAAGVGLSTGIIAPNIILSSNTNAPGGGGAGAIGAGGTGGSVPTIATQNSSFGISGWGFWAAIVGIVGAAGGAQTGAAGVAVGSIWNTLPLSAGAGGGGVNTVSTGFAGGACNLQSGNMDLPDMNLAQVLAGGAAGSASAAGNGNPGRAIDQPFLITGGSGGGSSDGSTGGIGGQGGPGCGGGGGGAGVTGGAGGRGGDGFIVIISK